MNKSILFLLIQALLPGLTYSQSWSLLPNSPSAPFRHDDIYFIHADTGWVVNLDGYIYKTTNGGNDFITQLFQPATSFRCVGFANENTGWAGNLGTGSFSPTTDTVPLYKTVDGGETWLPVISITGGFPKGICGLSVINDSTAFAVGRNGGPAFFLKTTDGIGWTSFDMAAEFFELIDCRFFSADTGFIAGNTASGDWATSSAKIMKTTDGGNTWQTVFISSKLSDQSWKIFFLNKTTGFVSNQTAADTVRIFKTIDGGQNWNELPVSYNNVWLQGIGFINDTVGWTGADIGFQTNDGGLSWTSFNTLVNFNRFRKINDSLAYACGNRIWKYSNEPTGINQLGGLSGLILEQNTPNPFTDKTIIQYAVPEKGKVTLKIYDFAGRLVTTLVNRIQRKGTYQTEFKLNYKYDANFYAVLYFNEFMLTRKMLMMQAK